MGTLYPFVMQKYVHEAASKCFAVAKNRFTYLKEALYATDVVFQRANAPMVELEKEYWSDKHQLHGHKVEVSIATGSWAMLVSNGYRGAEVDVRAIGPASDSWNREPMAGDRSIFNKFLGHLTALWEETCDEYARDVNDVYFQTCVALTNVHVRSHPPQNEDEDAHRLHLNYMKDVADKANASRQASRDKQMKKSKMQLAALRQKGKDEDSDDLDSTNDLSNSTSSD
ncbi:TPA: hypothetical protein N0F65_003539 [Lagenidium giganteum]|uniref:DDE Tnp4 domain-containing protein n=1 Tax=Lagenidium giganteum TaxID=4803 RepID=A0AAV2YYH6_9STRA|nr:TPA: hypothetical protein N0F65_003539 [Lagenidium giganteum]